VRILYCALALLSFACVSVLGSGCGADEIPATSNSEVTAGASASIPEPEYATIITPDYRLQQAADYSLFGPSSAERVLLSISPVLDRGYSGNNLQVISWDRFAGRWNVVFDARDVLAWPVRLAPDVDVGPLLQDGNSVLQVEVVECGPGTKKALVFLADVTGADGASELAIVTFSGQEARLDYCASFQGFASFEVTGSPPNQQVAVESEFIGPLDGHAFPPRRYHFSLASTDQGFCETLDDRPWLGVYAQPGAWPYDSDSGPPMLVTGIVPGSPAEGRLEPGDLILSVKNVPLASNDPTGQTFGVAYYLEKLTAGSDATLEIRRQQDLLQVKVKLGSVVDASARQVAASSWYVLPPN
jgi:hypothetical protein